MLSTYLSWILWPGKRVTDYFYSSCEPKTKYNFRAHLESKARDWPRDDLENRISQDLDQVNRLTQIMRGIVEDYDISVRFFDGEPRIEIGRGGFTRWIQLTELFDPDSLICFCYADRYRTGDADYLRWPLVYRPHAMDINNIFREGLSDLHIHLGSVLNVSYLWQQVLSNDPAFPNVSLNRVRAIQSRSDDEATIERARIRDAVFRYQEGVLKPLRKHHRDVNLSSDWLHEGGKYLIRGTNPSEVMRPERAMLVNAWRILLNCDEQFESMSTEEQRLEQELQLYLTAKSKFRTRHLQEQNANPGLERFRATRSQILTSRYFGHPYRSLMSASMAILSDTPGLSRAELRVSSPSSPQAFKDTLSVFRSSRRSSTRASLDLKLGFSFKRFTESGEKGYGLRGSLIKYGKSTAALQQVRLQLGQLDPNDEERALLHEVSRLDIASSERAAPIWLLAYNIRLLRGDRQAILSLQACEDHEFYHHWKFLANQKQLRAPSSVPALGITCHAGEDYFSLVDGLWSIHAAMYGLNLGRGDGLGHGLALGATQPSSYLKSKLIPAGLELDSMAWLRRFLMLRLPGNSSLVAELATYLEEKSRQIYGTYVSPERLARKSSLYHLPLHIKNASQLSGPTADKLTGLENDSEALGDRWRDLNEEKVQAARLRMVPMDRLQERLIATLPAVQECLLSDIAKAGIVVESNPSSNFRISGLDERPKLPLFRMISAQPKDLMATLSTDNPGMYDITIESEYALMHEAMAQLSEDYDSRHARNETLEKLRDSGMNQVNWAASVPFQDHPSA